jgi:hypothetical protein
MTTSPKSSSLLKAAPLWAKSSVKGGQYLTGRLGAMKILIRENRDRQGDDEPSHHLFFTEVLDRRQGAQERGDRARGLQHHPGHLRRHQKRSAGASRSRSMMMRRSGRDEGGDFEKRRRNDGRFS